MWYVEEYCAMLQETCLVLRLIVKIYWLLFFYSVFSRNYFISLIYAVRCKQSEVFYLELKQNSIYIFLWVISLQCTIIQNFYNFLYFPFPFLYFPFPTLRIYTILCPSENFPCNKFTVKCNKYKQHSLSLTTFTPTAVLPTPIQLYSLRQTWVLSLVPQFTWQKSVDCNNLQWLWSKM